MIDAKNFSSGLLPVIRPFSGADVKELRENVLGVSRPVFAQLFNSPVSTVRGWERATSKLKGGDLVLANMLERKGLYGYLRDTQVTGSDSAVSKAAYALLAAVDVKKNGVTVPHEVIEGLRASLGLIEPLSGGDDALAKAKLIALFRLAGEIETLIDKSDSIDDLKSGLRGDLIQIINECAL